MATTEEVQILVKAVGDASGLQPVTNALKDVQQQGQAVQQQLTSAEQAQQAAISRGLQESVLKYRQGVEQANQLLRQTITNVPHAGAQDVRFLASQIAGATGTRPTLTPRDLGISTDTARLAQDADAATRSMESLQKATQSVSQTAGARPTPGLGIQTQQLAEGTRQLTAAGTAASDASKSVEGLGSAFHLTGGEVARLALSFAGVGVGLSAFSAAGQLAHQVLSNIVTDTVALNQAQTENTIALGTQAQGFQQWAAAVSEQAGVTQQSLLRAGTAAAQFGQSVGFGPQQTTQLTAMATLLGRIHGLNTDQALNQLTAAMQGNASAAQALNLQLSASYVAYTQLGGATAEVFNALDPTTQAALRAQAALAQLANQTSAGVTPAQELAKAQGELNTQWENFVQTVGPGVVGGLASILDLANKYIEAQRILNQLNEQQNQTGQAPSIDDKLQQIQSAQQQAAEAQQARNQQLQSMLSGPMAQLQAAQQQEIAAEKQVVDLRHQSVQLTAQEAAIRLQYLPQQQATATAQNAAQQQQIEMQQQLLPAQRAIQDLVNQTSQAQLAAAQQVLPMQREMEDLQNRTTRAAIQAQQATLPSSRAVEDLQNQIELQRLIAEDPTQSFAARQAAMQQGRTLEYQVNRAQEAALRARIAATPAQRAAEDVGAAAQIQGLDIAQTLAPTLRAAEDAQRAAEKLTLEQADAMKEIARTIEDLSLSAQKQALEQAAALMPVEFQQQTVSDLSQIAQAAADAAQQRVEIALGGVQVVIQSQQISDADWETIRKLVGDTVVNILHQAVGQANSRPASLSLIGAGGAA